MTFGISARILAYQSGFCTVFHCSTNPFVPSSTAVQHQGVSIRYLGIPNPSLSSQNKKRLPFCPSTTRAVTPGVSVMSCLSRCTRATAVVLHRPGDAASFASGCAAGGALMHAGCACRHIRPSAPSATGCAATFFDDISVLQSVYKPCMESGCAARARMRHAPAAHPTQHLSTRGSARPRAYISAWSRQSRASAAHGCGAEQCDQGLRRGCILI